MCNCRTELKKLYCAYLIAGAMMLYAGSRVFADAALQPAVQSLAQKAFTQKTAADVRQFFEKHLGTA